MIISRTPFRVSLFGGGSDYPQWYRKNGGAVVGFAINKYCYISLRPLPQFFQHKHRLVYSKVETVSDISEIQHPAVRNVLEDMRIEYGVEIHHDGDLPARSGLGSSSSFTVGLINALNAQAGRMVSKDRLAREAIRIEQDVIQENVGSQDQIWAAYGGMNHIEFSRDGDFAVRPVIMPTERRDHMLGSLMLFFTGLSRFAHKVAGDKIANLGSHESHVRSIMQMADEGLEIVSNPDRALDDLGRLLHESWMIKRELASSVTTPEVDAIYQAAMEGGALGGKLLGAGGGGFILFYVEPGKQQAVRDKLAGLVEVHFKIDADGSRIVVYEPEL